MNDLKSTTISRLDRYNSNKDITINNKDIYTISFLNHNEEYIIFSYLYSDIYTDEIDFISISNNILSRDGSYMSNFFKSTYINLFDNKILEKVLSIFEKKMNDYKLKLRYELVYSRMNNNKILQTNLFCVKILSIYIILTYIFKKQSRIFSKEFINEIFYDYDIVKELHITNLTIKDINNHFNSLGQKITPKGFYYKDKNLIKSKEYNHESFVLYSLSKKVFEKKTPAFSILISSIYLSNVNVNIFDNNNIRRNLEISNQIVNDKKNKLTDIFSNKVNIFILEDCGLSLPLYIQNYGKLLGDIFNDKNSLNSIIFQLCHSVYILNTLGFAHGDAHFANITVRETNKWFNISNDNAKKSYSIFKTQNSKYFVRFYGAYITLLDMGRIIDVNYVERNKKEVIAKINKICDYSIKSKDSVKLLIAYNACDIIKMLINIDTIINLQSSDYSDENNISYIYKCIQIIINFIKKTDKEDIINNSADIKEILSNSSSTIISSLFKDLEIANNVNKFENVDLNQYLLIDEFNF
jgi:hypothetical protein